MSEAVARRLGNPNWIKGGPSPNPTGRRPDDPAIRELALSYCPDAIHALARLAGIAVDRHGKPLAGARNENSRILALRELLDRGLGRARQELSVDGDGSVIALHLVAAQTVSGELVADLEHRTLLGRAQPAAEQHQTPDGNLLDAPVPTE